MITNPIDHERGSHGTYHYTRSTGTSSSTLSSCTSSSTLPSFVTTRRGYETSQLEQQRIGVGVHPPWRHQFHPPWRHQYREKGAIHGAQILEDRHGAGRTCRVAFGRVSVRPLQAKLYPQVHP